MADEDILTYNISDEALEAAGARDDFFAARESGSGPTRSADRVRKRLMLGVDRTYDGHHESEANDPKRHFPC